MKKGYEDAINDFEQKKIDFKRLLEDEEYYRAWQEIVKENQDELNFLMENVNDNQEIEMDVTPIVEAIVEKLEDRIEELEEKLEEIDEDDDDFEQAIEVAYQSGLKGADELEISEELEEYADEIKEAYIEGQKEYLKIKLQLEKVLGVKIEDQFDPFIEKMQKNLKEGVKELEKEINSTPLSEQGKEILANLILNRASLVIEDIDYLIVNEEENFNKDDKKNSDFQEEKDKNINKKGKKKRIW